jgi:hypothetical protein
MALVDLPQFACTVTWLVPCTYIYMYMYLRLGPYKVLYVWLYKPIVNLGTPLHLNI